MTARKRRWLKILSLLLFISAGLFVEMTKLAPKRYKTRIEIVEHEKIPKAFDNVSIAYFSDVLGDFANLNKVFETINTTKPDLILFSGNISNKALTEEEKTELIEQFSKLQAPLGKYSVIASEDTKHQNYDVLESSGFKTLTSTGNLIYSGSDSAIELIGINEPLETSNEASDYYTIALMNDPNMSFNVNYDLLLAGKNLGGQIIIPFIGPLMDDSDLYQKRYDRKEYSQIITQGLGTLKYDARLLTHPETVLIVLKSGVPDESQ